MAVDTGPAASTAFPLAVLRATETIIAIMAAFAIALIIAPRSIQVVLTAAITEARKDLMALVRQTLQHREVFPIKLRQKMTTDLVQIHVTLRAYRLEHGPIASGAQKKTAAVANDLARVDVAKEMLARALSGCPNTFDDPKVDRVRSRFHETLAEIPATPETAEEARLRQTVARDQGRPAVERLHRRGTGARARRGDVRHRAKDGVHGPVRASGRCHGTTSRPAPTCWIRWRRRPASNACACATAFEAPRPPRATIISRSSC